MLLQLWKFKRYIYYYFECKNSYCKNCVSKYLKKKIIIKYVQNILNIIKIIVKHVNYYYVKNIPLFILNMNYKKKFINYEGVNNFKDKIKKILKERNEFINKIQSYILKYFKI